MDDITDTALLIKQGKLFHGSDVFTDKAGSKIARSVLIYRLGSTIVYPLGSLEGLQEILDRECLVFPGTSEMENAGIRSLHVLFNGLAGTIVDESLIANRKRSNVLSRGNIKELEQYTYAPRIAVSQGKWTCTYFVLRETRMHTCLLRYSAGGDIQPMTVSEYAVKLVAAFGPDHFGEPEPE